MVPRVVATAKALVLIDRLAAEHGPLMFHQSGGCCDGATPMCFKVGEMPVSDATDVLLGHVGGVPYYVGRSLADVWENTQILLDVVAGDGGTFSLEQGSGQCFHTTARLFTDEEIAALPALR